MDVREEGVGSAEANQGGGDGYTKRKMAFLDTLLTSTIDDRPLTLQEIYEEVSTFMFEVRIERLLAFLFGFIWIIGIFRDTIRRRRE